MRKQLLISQCNWHWGLVLFVALSANTSIMAQNAKYAVVPGFERFHANDNAKPVEGGQLLLGELNCLSCHSDGDLLKSLVLPKQAPVLDQVGSRVRASYLKNFLNDPHGTKPGTAMPNVLAGLTDAEKKEAVEALTHLLASTGTVNDTKVDWGAVNRGKTLYAQTGCVACHGTRNNEGISEVSLATSIPLTKLEDKYSIPSLTSFLVNPHASRPSGRMPNLLNAKEAQDVANYLLQKLPAPPPNLAYSYYEGSFGNLPDFSKLKPRDQGKINGFSIAVARRRNDYAIKYEGYLPIDRPGNYKFFLRSDDGSQLFIDDKLVVDNDGEHAPQMKNGQIELSKGVHKLVVTFFQKGGGDELRVEMQGPRMRKQVVDSQVRINKSAVEPKSTKKDDDTFVLNEELAQKGSMYFAKLNCASCHQLNYKGKTIQPMANAPALAKLGTSGGCLSEKTKAGVPQFQLTGAQRNALAKAIGACAKPLPKPTTEKQIVTTMTTFNCYACHERNKIGGPEEGLSKFFTTAQPEMGEEGRIPPALTNVGAKIATEYMKKILANGANDRPYMHTRMPKFGLENTGHLVTAYEAVDSIPAVPPIKFAIDQIKVKAIGRHIVGGKALGCIKCHTFKGQQAEGVQGIDMTLMHERLKRDWFAQYLLDPSSFRPGTRMPTAWPKGQSPFQDILDGDSKKQIEAIWVYLSDGKGAALPIGANPNFIELFPDGEAVLYRNFIQGAGSRAIGVGYPESLNLAFDANNMRLALIWQGAFMDASRHWTNRGQGYQPPLGDNVMSFPDQVAFAELAKLDQPWPDNSAKDLGFSFGGYSLTNDRRPTFYYTFNGVEIADFPNAVPGEKRPMLKRTFTLKAKQPLKSFYFRAATGSTIEKKADGWYQVGNLKIRLESAAEPVIRQVGNQKELLVPIRFKNNQANFVMTTVW